MFCGLGPCNFCLTPNNPILFPEHPTLALTTKAFMKPESYYKLGNISSRQARDIEKFFERGFLNEFKIKVH